MRNVPKLRFPEFNGEWEEKKLSDIVSFSKRRTEKKSPTAYDKPLYLLRKAFIRTLLILQPIQ